MTEQLPTTKSFAQTWQDKQTSANCKAWLWFPADTTTLGINS
jgi:hypothetical protein